MIIPKLIRFVLYHEYEDNHLISSGLALENGFNPEILKCGDNSRIEKACLIEAATWEEANAIFNLRQGYEPYKPIGKAEECPNTIAHRYFCYYPMSSGKCFCGYDNDKQ